jgi:hypothetical protein
MTRSLFGRGETIDDTASRFPGFVICWKRRLSRIFKIFLVLPVVCLVQQPHPFQLHPPLLQAAGIIGVDPQLGPQPPCGKEPIPSYPSLQASAIVNSWSVPDFGRDWRPPACTGWTEVGFTTLVTIVARFRYASETQGLLRHIGAISERAGARYWSTTHKQWQTLVVDAYAVTDSHSGQRREDFTLDELEAGKVLYFEQADNLSGKAIYRMHIAEASTDRVVLDIENVNTMRYFFLPIFHPGEVQSIFFLDRESDGVWRYYSIVRTGKSANRRLMGNESSSINRAVAFYRQLAGIPTDQEPPAAR